MKRLHFIRCLTILSLSFAINVESQNVSHSVIINFNRIVRYIENDSIAKLANLISYPLIRENPLPDITSAEVFVKYYPILFDKAFKEKLKYFNDSDIFEHHGAYGIDGDNKLPNGDRFDGDIWIDDSGKIVRINYSSEKEQALSQKITRKIKSEIYPSVNDWETNIEVLESEKYLIRIDRISKGIRYVSWGKGKKISDAPDLVLYDGIEEAQGTQGGWTWTFKSGNWQYVIEDNEMCEDEKDCGFFLVVMQNGTEKSRMKCKELKQ